jgi:hypothetical protein
MPRCTMPTVNIGQFEVAALNRFLAGGPIRAMIVPRRANYHA